MRTCKHCGSALHWQTSIRGVSYWASNSGSAWCVWPMQHMRHDADVAPAERGTG